MGTALLKGWIRSGAGAVIVVEPRPSPELRKLARGKNVSLVASVGDVGAKKFRACVVALKPQILKDEAPLLRGFAEGGAAMISIAAGTNTKSLAKAWGPRARIIRAMPNTPGAIGRGITGLYAAKGAGAKDRKLAEKLLSALGETLWVGKESQIDAVTAVSGSGPAYLFLMVEALAQAGVAEGLPPAIAMRLARATMAGAGALLDADKSEAAELRRAVTSPGGTTEAALKVLMTEDGLAALMKCAVSAARKRAEELG
jgi:pyrroline-5-carboxylate reductase